METKLEFTCPYTIEERYQMITTGEYGVFEMYGSDGSITGYRGYRKEFGTTGVYDNYRDAMEAALTEYGPKNEAKNMLEDFGYVPLADSEDDKLIGEEE